MASAAADRGKEDRPWVVNLTDEADADLKRLRGSRRTRKVWQEAVRIATSLEVHPTPLTLGDPCDPPLVGVRRVHFWNDKYRLAWLVIEEDRRVDILAVGRKTSTFYASVLVRLIELRERIEELRRRSRSGKKR